MRTVSEAYKNEMNKKIRNQKYVSIGLGIMNQEAQSNAYVDSETTLLSSPQSIFDNNQYKNKLSYLEQDFVRCGSFFQLFPPEEHQKIEKCAISKNLIGEINIRFRQRYSIKGLTLMFGEAYPTEFKVVSDNIEKTYTNDSEKFETYDVFDDTEQLTIIPISMVGGQQRLRIYSINMGVGLIFTNRDIKRVNIQDSCPQITNELPHITMTAELHDLNNYFNVDAYNSFIHFLESGQKVSISFGTKVENGNVEWVDIHTLYLSDFDSLKGSLTINATDKLSMLNNEYSLGNRIYTRTAYDEAESILNDAGLEPDEYEIDMYLRDVTLTNPMPVASHKECLQTLANACRCKITQNPNGAIEIKSNFSNVLDPDDISISTNGVASWSNTSNLISANDVIVFSDFSENLISHENGIVFPSESNATTSYVSNAISDENGLFEVNPYVEYEFSTYYQYFGFYLKFNANPPKKIMVEIFGENITNAIDRFYVYDLDLENIIRYDFKPFVRIRITFMEHCPNSRVYVSKLSFGSVLVGYELNKTNMLSEPHGFVEAKTRSVRVKVCSFVNNEENVPELVEDNVFFEKSINNTGTIKIVENQLIATAEHASEVANWIANYYANNVSYDVEYRGDARIESSDFIKLESDVISNLQVVVEEHSLTFDGGLSGTMQLRRNKRYV